ncbi:hypothetical protein BDZ90DRAFT_87739 [Jaminaea rosea]|uniref:Uncharacterized protein n=1 Tax=Jaminaea rosea TaxID=1569628 RepID=A0A316UIX1_9BASI|nr:hypothetical protein BDZ90DRAFT_87739 [Jaminaea rosea]PWN24874.1 hypothetical protein BDZ90DRAFT_87739 [Jaminaea rosea]
MISHSSDHPAQLSMSTSLPSPLLSQPLPLSARQFLSTIASLPTFDNPGPSQGANHSQQHPSRPASSPSPTTSSPATSSSAQPTSPIQPALPRGVHQNLRVAVGVVDCLIDQLSHEAPARSNALARLHLAAAIEGCKFVACTLFYQDCSQPLLPNGVAIRRLDRLVALACWTACWFRRQRQLPELICPYQECVYAIQLVAKAFVEHIELEPLLEVVTRIEPHHYLAMMRHQEARISVFDAMDRGEGMGKNAAYEWLSRTEAWLSSQMEGLVRFRLWLGTSSEGEAEEQDVTPDEEEANTPAATSTTIPDADDKSPTISSPSPTEEVISPTPVEPPKLPPPTPPASPPISPEPLPTSTPWWVPPLGLELANINARTRSMAQPGPFTPRSSAMRDVRLTQEAVSGALLAGGLIPIPPSPSPLVGVQKKKRKNKKGKGKKNGEGKQTFDGHTVKSCYAAACMSPVASAEPAA